MRASPVSAVADDLGLPGQLRQGLLSLYRDRITGPDNDDLADDLTVFYGEAPALGQYGLFLPTRPPMIYPPGGTIYADVYNGSAVTLTNLQLYFRGQKVFAKGVLDSFDYPSSFKAAPFIITATVTLNETAAMLNNVFSTQPYADFALRSLTIGAKNPATNPTTTNGYYEVSIMLRDVHGRSYSNVPVNVDVCFGGFGSMVSGLQTDIAVPQSYGNWLPPLLMPEIYLPANQILYYDLYRADAYLAASLPSVALQLAFAGANITKR